MLNLTVIILASGLPKGNDFLAGRPLAHYVVDSVRALEPANLVVVGESGTAELDRGRSGTRIYQVALAGGACAGRTVHQALQALTDRGQTVLVLWDNMPLLQPTALRRIVDRHQSERAMATTLASRPEDTKRGVFCFDASWLWSRSPQLAACEADLSSLAVVAADEGLAVLSLRVPDPLDVLEVDDQLVLARAGVEMRRRINERHMLAGVTLVHPDTTFIEAGVEIGAGTVIWPNTYAQGETRIGQGCVIGPGAVIRDSSVGDRCKVELSVIEGAIMEEGSDIGPFGHLRKGAHLGPGVHMGNFGEVKNSYLGPGVAMGHMSYLGDATVGARVNIGAGTITCNYDGKNKNRTIIGDEAFVGSDSMLVAPVEIGAGAKTGAGSVVTRDIPPGQVAYGVPARVKGSPDEEETEDGLRDSS